MKRRPCKNVCKFVVSGLFLVFAVAGLSAQTQRMVFAHYMVTNQDYQGDTDPTQELKIAAYERGAKLIGKEGQMATKVSLCRLEIHFYPAKSCRTSFNLSITRDAFCG